MKHPHADLMLQYAKDAAHEKQPYLLWEFSIDGKNWETLVTHPCWNLEHKYRRKTQTININGFDVPEPIRHAPEKTEILFRPTLSKDLFIEFLWNKSDFCKQLLERGLIHRTKEAAEMHALALISFTQIPEEK